MLHITSGTNTRMILLYIVFIEKQYPLSFNNKAPDIIMKIGTEQRVADSIKLTESHSNFDMLCI